MGRGNVETTRVERPRRRVKEPVPPRVDMDLGFGRCDEHGVPLSWDNIKQVAFCIRCRIDASAKKGGERSFAAASVQND